MQRMLCSRVLLSELYGYLRDDRLFWLVLVVVTVGVFVYYVIDRVSEYTKFKKNISVEENYVAEMPFPSVTICNQNRIR